MNEQYNSSSPVLNLREFVWDLLEQWKAILIVALIVMILFAGFKYARDINNFNSSANQKASEEASGVTTAERVSKIIDSLPEDERATVEYVVNQNEWMDTEKEYVNNSLLLNTNPANQRTLILDYYITTKDSSDSIITSLVFAYSGYVSSDKMINTLAEALGSDAEKKYIAELVSANNGNAVNGVETMKNNYTSTDDDSAVVEVRVVLPEGADASGVENAISSAIKDYSPELSSKVGDHSINLIKSGEAYLHNESALISRNNIIQSIYNQQVNVKNMQTSLSEGQKSAIERISSIKKESRQKTPPTDEASKVEVQEKPSDKPGISKKYALLGFVLGVMCYVLVYLIKFISKGRIGSAQYVEYYTKARLLGELYFEVEHKGLEALLHSKVVNKYRYKGKLDVEKQLKLMGDSLSAVCEHSEVDDVTLFDLTGRNDVEELLKRNCEVAFKHVTLSDMLDEKMLVNVEHAVIAIGKNTKASMASNLSGLCQEYDAKKLGSLYFSEV